MSATAAAAERARLTLPRLLLPELFLAADERPGGAVTAGVLRCGLKRITRCGRGTWLLLFPAPQLTAVPVCAPLPLAVSLLSPPAGVTAAAAVDLSPAVTAAAAAGGVSVGGAGVRVDVTAAGGGVTAAAAGVPLAGAGAADVTAAAAAGVTADAAGAPPAVAAASPCLV